VRERERAGERKSKLCLKQSSISYIAAQQHPSGDPYNPKPNNPNNPHNPNKPNNPNNPNNLNNRKHSDNPNNLKNSNNHNNFKNSNEYLAVHQHPTGVFPAFI
jgi:hypothetical protein